MNARPSDQEAIEARAAAWIAQRDEGLAPAEAAAFAAWQAADPAHAAAVARLEHVWAALHDLRDFRPEALAHPDPDLLAPARRRRTLRFPLSTALAAAAIALLCVAGWQAAHRPGPDPATPGVATYATAAGGYQRISLADGSVVELNAGTALEVRYTPHERRVRLAQGEAHFTVAPNKERPFFVEAQNVSVRAVGTAFDVRLQPQKVDVLVTAGRVRVDRDDVPVALPNGESILTAGWRASVPTQHEAASVEKLATAQVRHILAWQSSRLVFVDTPLSEVIDTFNRHNRIQVVVTDAELASLPIGGSFNAQNVESFVRLLASNGEIIVEQSGDELRLRRR